jgi:hypothetical protein
MRLQGICVGDIVLVDRKGRLFHAEVVGTAHRRSELAIKPIERGITYYTASAQDVVAHWRRKLPFSRARSRPTRPAPPPAYAQLGELNP